MKTKKWNKGIVLNKGLIILAGVIILVVIVIAVLGSSKEKALDSLKKSITNQITSINNLLSNDTLQGNIDTLNGGNATINVNANIDTDIEDLDTLNDYDISLNIGYDKLNSLYAANLILKKDNKKNNVLFFQSRNHYYLSLKDEYSKYIDLGAVSDNSFFNFEDTVDETEKIDIKEDDINYLLTIIGNTIVSSIEEKDLKISESLTEVNSKKVNLKQISYVLDNTKYENIFNNISKALIDDDRAMTTLASISGKTIEEIEENLNNPPQFDGTDTFNIYVDKDYNLVKLTSSLDAEIDDIKTKNTFLYSYYNDLYTINYNDLIGSNKFELSYDDSKEDKKVIEYNIAVEIDSDETNKCNGKAIISTSVKDNVYSESITLSNNFYDDSDNKTTLDLILNLSVEDKMTIEIPTVNTTNSITIENAYNDEAFNNVINKWLGDFSFGA